MRDSLENIFDRGEKFGKLICPEFLGVPALKPVKIW